jgi:release factor glutamine methyltransferase
LKFERPLSDAEADCCRDLVRRRGRREPLQYILGSTSFCGLEIAVDQRVLIPRPETELLAEQGWRFLSRQAASRPPTIAGGAPPVTALDYGTGSGCLAIALAAHAPAVQVDAVDCSAGALAVARGNAARHGLGERIVFWLGDGFAALDQNRRYDLIVTNPPYIPGTELPRLQPEVRDFEPCEALNGGPDGLEFYRRLAAAAGRFLKPEGRLMAELGDGQAMGVRELFEAEKWIVEQILEDYTSRERILVARPAGISGNALEQEQATTKQDLHG